jgi:hypothetical protein
MNLKHRPAMFWDVRDTYREPLTRTSPSGYRVALSTLSLLAGVAVLIALSAQITEQILASVFVPEHYFSYFSIQTSLINIGVLILSGMQGFQSPRDSTRWTAIRAHIVAYAVITGVVYNVLLRAIPPAPDSAGLPQWPNEIIHVWIPAYLLVDWLVNPHRTRLTLKASAVGVLFPLAWVTGSLLRGYLTDWYPYAFMNPTGELGVPGVLAHLGVIALLIIFSLVATGLINKIHRNLRSDEPLLR